MYTTVYMIYKKKKNYPPIHTPICIHTTKEPVRMTVSNPTFTGNLIMKIHSNHDGNLALFSSHKGKRRKINTLKDFYLLWS